MNSAGWKAGLVLAFAMLVVLGGCRSNRAIIKEPIRGEGPEYLFSQLKENEARFDDLTARFTATLIREKDRTHFSGQIRIRRDSLIWISISPALGIEAIRVLISRDSVFMLNRINKTFMARDFGYINHYINAALDYDMLQAFLIGNDFAFYEVGEFRASIDGGEYRLNTSNRRKIKRYIRQHQEVLTIPLQSIWLDPETFKITRVMVKELEVEGRKVTATYSGFSPVNERPFPTQITFGAKAEPSIDLELNYSRVEMNSATRFPYKVPASYTSMP